MAVKIQGGGRIKAYLKQLESNIKDSQSVRAGFLEGATYPDGTSVAQVAAVQEFGSLRKTKDGRQWVPPRPFLRTAVAANKDEWAKVFGGTLKSSGYSAATALATVGQQMVSDIQESIEKYSDPPNAPSTIRQKGYDNPLQRTRHMKYSVDAEVIE